MIGRMTDASRDHPDPAAGERLLSAVERLLASDEALLEEARRCEGVARARLLPDVDARRAAASEEATRAASNKAAISGGLTSLPAVVPGLGSLLAVTGGALLDMAALLKFEVELALVLTAIHGYDIRRPEERRLAMLLAAAGVHDVKQGGNLLVDLANAEAVAIVGYGPRELTKLLTLSFARVALALASRGLAKALPVIGVAIGGGMNKVLTTRVGERLADELRRRRAARPPAPPGASEEPVVDAKVAPAGTGAS
jgi:hypothetical protein